jgi:hypothetical protein
MLRDGYFIKEAPPKIGAHYVPRFYVRSTTPEERFAQDVILGGVMMRPPGLLTRVLGRLLQV